MALGYCIRKIRVDNDSVLLSSAFRAVCEEHNIAIERTAPYSHWQHGRIERQWGTHGQMAQAMLHDPGMTGLGVRDSISM